MVKQQVPELWQGIPEAPVPPTAVEVARFPFGADHAGPSNETERMANVRDVQDIHLGVVQQPPAWMPPNTVTRLDSITSDFNVFESVDFRTIPSQAFKPIFGHLFSGKPDGMTPEDWLEKLGQWFRALNVPQSAWPCLASFRLTGDALRAFHAYVDRARAGFYPRPLNWTRSGYYMSTQFNMPCRQEEAMLRISQLRHEPSRGVLAYINEHRSWLRFLPTLDPFAALSLFVQHLQPICQAACRTNHVQT